jgi:hypothetical protein
MIRFIILAGMVMSFTGCSSSSDYASADNKTTSPSDRVMARNNSTKLVCKLTTTEMQNRRATVLASLKKQTLERKELPNGYAYRFNGSDTMFDQLTEFIKTERACCDFFTFNLSVAGDKNEIWMQITGPQKAKEFIQTEMEL